MTLKSAIWQQTQQQPPAITTHLYPFNKTTEKGIKIKGPVPCYASTINNIPSL